jgi:hypothetical protein
MTSEEFLGLSLVIIAVMCGWALLRYGGDQGFVKEVALLNDAEGPRIGQKGTPRDQRMQERRRDCFCVAVTILTVAVVWIAVVPRR